MSEVKESNDIEKIKAKVNELKKKYKQNIIVRSVPKNLTVKKSVVNTIRSTFRNNTINNAKIITNDQKNRDKYISELIKLQYTYQYIDVFNNLPDIDCSTLQNSKTLPGSTKKYRIHNKDLIYTKDLICKYLKVKQLIETYYKVISKVDGNVNRMVKDMVDKELQLDKLNIKYINFPRNKINNKERYIRGVNIPSLDQQSLKNYNKLEYNKRMKINEIHIKEIKKIYIILKLIEAYIKYYNLVVENTGSSSIKSPNSDENEPYGITSSTRALSVFYFIENYDKYGSIVRFTNYRDIFNYDKIDDIVQYYKQITDNITDTSSSSLAVDLVLGIFKAAFS